MSKDADHASLGLRLRQAREYRGFSQEDVATYLGIPRSAISLMESGDRRINAVELTRIAKLYDCSVAELAGETPVISADSASIDMVARIAATLSDDDRAEVMRFAEFLSHRKGGDK